MTELRTSNKKGTFALVLHSHLPWLLHHGGWPVGEEWLYQSWMGSYDRLFAMLRGLADEGRTNQVTLGVTPILTAQLDDPYALAGYQTWVSDGYQRALGMTAAPDSLTRRLGTWEAGRHHQALASFDEHWSGGGSAALRPLIDSGVIELLGGPAAHPFQPLLHDKLVPFSLQAGLNDAELRTGTRPNGIWAPECAYRPGLEDFYKGAGVGHYMMDGPSFHHIGVETDVGHPIGDSGVVAFARDLDVTYRVWFPRKGYPGGKWYRDFHAHGYDWGFRHQRVTSRTTPAHEKAPYEPDRAAAALDRDVEDFVETVVRRLDGIKERTGRRGLTIAGYDTELYGHWWLEGPDFLGKILRRLPEVGVEVSTLQGALDAGLVGDPIRPESGSWGKNKDWHVWAGESVHGIVADHANASSRVLEYLKGLSPEDGRSLVADQLVRDLLLTLSSDWAFMVSHNSAAEYAWGRHHDHLQSLHELADAVEAQGWDGERAIELAQCQRHTDAPFGHLDARKLA